MALLPVAEALARVLEGVAPLPAETAPLAEAVGRVLANDVAALRTHPPAAARQQPVLSRLPHGASSSPHAHPFARPSDATGS